MLKEFAGHIEGAGWSYQRGWLVMLKVWLGTVRSHMVVPNDWLELRKPSVMWFLEIRRPVGSSDLHRKGFGDQMLRLWRCHFEALEPQEAPKKLPRGSHVFP